MVGSVVDNHIFWGAIKKVIADMLRDSSFDDSFWMELLSSNAIDLTDRAKLCKKTKRRGDSEAVYPSKVQLALNQICISALEDYHQEDISRVQRLLDYVTQPYRTRDGAMLIALKVVVGVLSRAENPDASSTEAQVLRRALRHSKAEIRFEAARTLAAMINRSAEFPLQLLKEMQMSISTGIRGIRILQYSLPRKRKQLADELDSFFHLTLFITGEHFDNTRLRDQVFSLCLQVINTVYSNRFFIVFKSQFINLVARRIARAYWDKGALPCNYLEMHLSLQSDIKHVTDRIGVMFSNPTVPADLVVVAKEMLSIENGLITWYMYSLFAIYAQQEEQTQIILDVLQQLYDEADGHSPTRYMVVQSLWVITMFSSASKLSSALYVKYSKRLLDEYGGWAQFKHRAPEDPTVKRFLDETDSEGRRRAYWVLHLDKSRERILCRYDNSAMKGLAEYLIRNEHVYVLEFVIDLLNSERWKGDLEFLFYTIATLGDIGERHSTVALKTLGRIIECKPGESDHGPGWWDFTTDFRGKVCNVTSTLTESLIRIKSFHPQRVETFIDKLSWDDHEMLKRVKSEQISQRSDIVVSYYGEFIYQKLFLNFAYMPDLFGVGVKESGRTDRVEEFFKPYVRNLLEMTGEHARSHLNFEKEAP